MTINIQAAFMKLHGKARQYSLNDGRVPESKVWHEGKILHMIFVIIHVAWYTNKTFEP
jgi:hypothetical protein